MSNNMNFFKRRKRLIVPFLQIEPTTRCNYTYGFCAGRSLPQIDMSIETFKTVSDNIEHLEHVEIQGEGEPFLSPYLFEMISLLRDKFPDVLVSTITNGSFLTRENIDRLIQYKVDKVIISMESVNAEIYHSIRGGKFDHIEQGIKRLQEAKIRLNSNIPELGLAIVVLKKTINQFGQIGKFYKDLNLDGGIILKMLNKMDYYVKFYDNEMKSQFLNEEDIKQFNIKHTDTSESQWLKEHKGNIPIFYQHLYKQPLAKPACPWLEYGLFISANGTACACCFIKNPEDGFALFSSENLNIIHNEKKAMQKQLQSGKMPKLCRNCKIAAGIVAQVNHS